MGRLTPCLFRKRRPNLYERIQPRAHRWHWKCLRTERKIKRLDRLWGGKYPFPAEREARAILSRRLERRRRRLKQLVRFGIQRGGFMESVLCLYDGRERQISGGQ